MTKNVVQLDRLEIAQKQRIAHINNPADVAGIISREQKERGIQSDVFVFNQRSKRFFPDANFVTRYNLFSYLRFFRRLKTDFDLWHYHFPAARLWKLLSTTGTISNALKRGIKILYHFHGADLRARGSYDDFCLVSTPDLLPRALNGIWLPNPIPIEYTAKYIRKDYSELPNVPRVIYFADFNFKANVNDYITPALRELQSAGRIEAVATLNFTYDDLLKEIAKSDIMIGKIRPDMGWFGKFELEGMVNGIPVMAYVSDDLFNKYKPPVCRTTKNTFKQDLEALLKDYKLCRELRERGPHYVKELHDSKKVITQLQTYYDKI